MIAGPQPDRRTRPGPNRERRQPWVPPPRDRAPRLRLLQQNRSRNTSCQRRGRARAPTCRQCIDSRARSGGVSHNLPIEIGRYLRNSQCRRHTELPSGCGGPRPWRDSCERSGASAITPMPRRHLPGLDGLVFHVMNRAIEGVTLFEHPTRTTRSLACWRRPADGMPRAAGLLRDAKPLASRRATHSRSSAVGVHAVADDNARTAMATGVLHSRSRRRVSGSFQVGPGRAGSPLPPALLVRRAESGSCEDHDAR